MKIRSQVGRQSKLMAGVTSCFSVNRISAVHPSTYQPLVSEQIHLVHVLSCSIVHNTVLTKKCHSHCHVLAIRGRFMLTIDGCFTQLWDSDKHVIDDKTHRCIVAVDGCWTVD